MAKVLSEAGRYVSDRAAKQSRAMTKTVLVAVCALSVIGGFLMGWFLGGAKNPLWTGIIAVVLAMAIFRIWRRTDPKLDELEKKRLAMRRGANGESAVALALASFPVSFVSSTT